METTTETLTSETTVVTRKIIDAVLVGDKVVIYRLIVNKTCDKWEKPHLRVEEGITSRAGLEAFRNGAESLPPFMKNQVAVLGTPALVEAMRTHGWLDDEFSKLIQANINTPYTRWMTGEARVEDIILFDDNRHRCHDWQGVPISCAIFFNYIDGRITDGQYDLKRALEILKARKDIRFWGVPLAKEDGEVLQVPYYNKGPGCNEFLSFVWMPSQEDYLKMGKRATTYRQGYSSAARYRAVFDEDLLGLRAGGAARHNDFSARDADDDSDDD